MEQIESFDEMNLSDNLLRGIYGYGFEKPSIIQLKSIPLFQTGKDLIAQSQSGTGKTGSFLIGILSKINEQHNITQGIVLAHTKELAIQIHGVATNLSKYMNLKIILCIGGTNVHTIRNEMRGKPTLFIGTPGKISSLVSDNIIDSEHIHTLVLDEADELLSFSFQDQIKTIILSLSDTTQICLFSATMPPEVMQVTSKFMREPNELLIEQEKLSLDGIKQFYINVGNDKYKFETLCDIYNKFFVAQTIIYVNTINRAIKLKEDLERINFAVSLIHSKMEEIERNNVMKNFRVGNSRILISTDLLSRGIDIQQISIVINYDIPKNTENYIHRIGRSGRYGRKGVAINLVSGSEEKRMANIANHYKTAIMEMPQSINEFL